MIKVQATGVAELARALRGRADRMHAAMQQATTRAALDVYRDARSNFAQAHGSIPESDVLAELKRRRKRKTARSIARTGRPLPPPGPLRMITGNLMRSMIWRVEQRGNQHVGIVGNQASYGRIHEEGGRAGRSMRATIPPRPYLGPALDRRRSAVLGYFAEAVRGVTHGK